MEDLKGNLNDLTSNSDEYIQMGIDYGLNFIAALLVFLIGKWVARKITRLMEKTLIKRQVDETLTNFLGNITFAILLTFVIITALGTLGINTATFAAAIAAAGLAIGLALQGSLSNFASGVMIIAFSPFKKGDFVEAGGTSGTVEEVHIFNTVLKTPDNKVVIVPNGAITSDNITNYSKEDTRRVDMVFGIGYDDDIKLAKETLEELLNADDRVLKDPAPKIAVSELADSSVNLICRPWVKTPDYWGLFWDMQEKVKITFDEKGISIPFPQRDVHVFGETAIEVANGNNSKGKKAA
jgi:small conductance mechanosensitive channel